MRTHHTYVDFQFITSKIGTYQTDWFIVPSFSGNNYLLILFDIDINSILSLLITNRIKHFINNAYANILKILKNGGLKHQLHILDNKS